MSKRKISSYQLEECSICFYIMNKYKNIINLKCTHSFHTTCIIEWCEKNNNIIHSLNNHIIIKGNCPICNTTFIHNINTYNNNNICCCYIL